MGDWHPRRLPREEPPHSSYESVSREVRRSREASVWRVLVHGVRQFTGKPGEELFAGETCLLSEVSEYVRIDGLLKLVRRNLLVGSGSHPRIGYVAVALLLEAVHQLTQAAAE